MPQRFHSGSSSIMNPRKLKRIQHFLQRSSKNSIQEGKPYKLPQFYLIDQYLEPINYITVKLSCHMRKISHFELEIGPFN